MEDSHHLKKEHMGVYVFEGILSGWLEGKPKENQHVWGSLDFDTYPHVIFGGTPQKTLVRCKTNQQDTLKEYRGGTDSCTT